MNSFQSDQEFGSFSGVIGKEERRISLDVVPQALDNEPRFSRYQSSTTKYDA